MQIDRQEFLKKYQEVCRWEDWVMAGVAVLGIAAYFGLPRCLRAVQSFPWMRVALGAGVIIVLLGPLVWFALAGAERRKRMGLRCPSCNVLFNRASMKEILKTGKCTKCGDAVIAD